MPHNQTHKIVPSSAVYYQNLIIIHECSKNLLTIKSVKSFLTPSITNMMSKQHCWNVPCLFLTQGAINVYQEEELKKMYLDNPLPPLTDGRRRVFVFHCEFSSHRGPKLLRYLRKQDREANLENYPALYYPELYLLNEGYKVFFEHTQVRLFMATIHFTSLAPSCHPLWIWSKTMYSFSVGIITNGLIPIHCWWLFWEVVFICTPLYIMFSTSNQMRRILLSK